MSNGVTFPELPINDTLDNNDLFVVCQEPFDSTSSKKLPIGNLAPFINASAPVQSVASKTGDVVLDHNDITDFNASVLSEVNTNAQLESSAQITGLDAELNIINSDISIAQADITTLQGNVSTINGEITTINGEISTINSDISTINTDLSGKLDKSGGTMTGALIASQVNPSTSNAAEFATTGYVAIIASGLSPSVSVYAATTSNLDATYNNGSAGVGATLTFNSVGQVTIDGDALDSEDVGTLILVKNQTDPTQNGIYTIDNPGDVATAGLFTRSILYDEPSELNEGKLFTVVFGTTQQGSQWLTTSINPVIGTDPVTFSIFTPPSNVVAGTGINVTGHVVSIANTSVTAGSYGSASKTLTTIVNAQGQETALSAVDIAITASQVTNFNTAAAAAAPVQSVAGRAGVVTLTHTDITDFNTATDGRIAAAVGVTVEAHSAELDAIAALNTTGIVQRTGAHTYNAGTITTSSISDFTTAVDGEINSLALLKANNLSDLASFQAALYSLGISPACTIMSVTGTANISNQLQSGSYYKITTATSTPRIGLPIMNAVDSMWLGSCLIFENAASLAVPIYAQDTTTLVATVNPGNKVILYLSNHSTANGTFQVWNSGTASHQDIAYFLQSANNLSDLANSATARNNLGLGTAAVQNTTYFLQSANNFSDLTNTTTALGNLNIQPTFYGIDLSTNYVLSNPLNENAVLIVSNVVAGNTITLPVMNASNSLQMSGKIQIFNFSPTPFNVSYHNIGITTPDQIPLGANEISTLVVVDKSNAAGLFYKITNSRVGNFINPNLSADYSLSNPFSHDTFILISTSSPGHSLILPPMNVYNQSLIKGGQFYIYNASANSVAVKYESGTSPFSVPPGNFYHCVLFDNSTSNGQITAFPYGTASNFDESHFALSARTVSAGGILSGGGDLTANRTLTLNRYDIYANVITETTTARTLAIADVNSTILCNNAAGNTTITLPTNASVAIPIGSMFRVSNATVNNSFVTNIVASGGVTFKQMGANSTVGQGGYVILQKIATNTWEVLQIQEFYTTSGNTFTGPWASAQAAEYTLYRNNRQVTWDIQLAQVGTTAFVSAPITTSQNLPVRFTPAVLRNEQMIVQSNASQNDGRVWFDVTGVITIYSTTARNNFSSTGSDIIISTGGMTWTM